MSKSADNVILLCAAAKGDLVSSLDALTEMAEEAKSEGRELFMEEHTALFIYTLSELLAGYNYTLRQILHMGKEERVAALTRLADTDVYDLIASISMRIKSETKKAG